MAPIRTKKCQIKWDTFFLIANGMIPSEYAIPPDNTQKKKGILLLIILGMNRRALQPIRQYIGMCNQRSLCGPNMATNVIPVIASPHNIEANTIPYAPPRKQSNIGVNVDAINK